jgi:hypothetical protein
MLVRLHSLHHDGLYPAQKRDGVVHCNPGTAGSHSTIVWPQQLTCRMSTQSSWDNMKHGKPHKLQLALQPSWASSNNSCRPAQTQALGWVDPIKDPTPAEQGPITLAA